MGHCVGLLRPGRRFSPRSSTSAATLAGDYGATVRLDRVFDNGWRVGAFATLTDVSFDDFGEGSFDKGITLEIPLGWTAGTATRQNLAATIRPGLARRRRDAERGGGG